MCEFLKVPVSSADYFTPISLVRYSQIPFLSTNVSCLYINH